MAIRKYKPTTPGRRGSSVADFAEITRSTPEKSLLVPLPKKGSKLYGGHAILAVGYDDNKMIGADKGALLIRNSWGTGWGMAGYFTIPYAYLTDRGLASDFWTIRLMEH